MKIPIYQVDAFTSKVFKGNPAAVCPLKEWLPDKIMQEIAKENNLSETAFFINKKNATFEEMNSLINFVKKKVKDKTGININLEIKIIE